MESIYSCCRDGHRYDGTCLFGGLQVGFTGTRKGMTKGHTKRLRTFLDTLDITRTTIHHGDCVGSDEEFHGIGREYGFKIVVHPPSSSRLRAWCQGDEILPVKPYITRNKDIVNVSSWLIAAFPGPEKEWPRSGTWATWRYAQQRAYCVSLGWE